MKGIVFTEFLEMVEQRFTADLADDIIDAANLPSGGVYTAVGTYPHQEIVALVQALSARSGIGVAELLRGFGQHLFGRFAVAYPGFFTTTHNALSFLAGIEDIIHAEVRKLYPDAELPKFDVEAHTSRQLVLRYRSGRHFEDLAEGLIEGCITHFGGGISVERQQVDRGPDRSERFTLSRQASNLELDIAARTAALQHALHQAEAATRAKANFWPS